MPVKPKKTHLKKVRQAKKLRNREYKSCLNKRAIVHLHDAAIDCNNDMNHGTQSFYICC